MIFLTCMNHKCTKNNRRTNDQIHLSCKLCRHSIIVNDIELNTCIYNHPLYKEIIDPLLLQVPIHFVKEYSILRMPKHHLGWLGIYNKNTQSIYINVPVILTVARSQYKYQGFIGTKPLNVRCESKDIDATAIIITILHEYKHHLQKLNNEISSYNLQYLEHEADLYATITFQKAYDNWNSSLLT